MMKAKEKAIKYLRKRGLAVIEDGNISTGMDVALKEQMKQVMKIVDEFDINEDLCANAELQRLRELIEKCV